MSCEPCGIAMMYEECDALRRVNIKPHREESDFASIYIAGDENGAPAKTAPFRFESDISVRSALSATLEISQRAERKLSITSKE